VLNGIAEHGGVPVDVCHDATGQPRNKWLLNLRRRTRFRLTTPKPTKPTVAKQVFFILLMVCAVKSRISADGMFFRDAGQLIRWHQDCHRPALSGISVWHWTARLPQET